jgi:radical S-adenosyl methionine domain-containing protein 2
MKCRVCYARNKELTPLSRDEMIAIVRKAANYGFRKINFVGGEPTLCHWLGDLIVEAKRLGLTTSIVTNGTLLNDDWLNSMRGKLDWLGVSIDSLSSETNRLLGRSIPSTNSPDLPFYLDLCKRIKAHGMKLKINTVVTGLNKDETFDEFFSNIQPDKWKIFQVLIIKGENDDAASLRVSTEEFDAFLQNNLHLVENSRVFPENSESMLGSYAMIDPSGCFVDNSSGYYVQSNCILESGIEFALGQINLNFKKYTARKNPDRLTTNYCDKLIFLGGSQDN